LYAKELALEIGLNQAGSARNSLTKPILQNFKYEYRCKDLTFTMTSCRFM
jgi:hypothetical protein